MSFTLPSLPYAYDALEPYIDAKTMEIHHGKHHQAYITNLNAAIEGSSWADMPLEELLKRNLEMPEPIRTAVRNNAGGHANHSLFWKTMTPSKNTTPGGGLQFAINHSFGSFEKFKEKFETAAKTRFGSGWAWLVFYNGTLDVYSTPNQDSPIMEGKVPLLGLDVWEHAYYLNYQNRRPDYVSAFWNVVNWEAVTAEFQEKTA